MNVARLRYEMAMSKISVDNLCAKTGISKSAFYRKIKGESEFTISEIQKICDLLGLDSPVGVFFADKVS